MASSSNNQSPALVVIALLFFAAANPLSHAQQLGPLTIANVLGGILPPELLNSITPVAPGVLNSLTPVVPDIFLKGLTAVVPGVLNSLTPVLPGVLNGLSGLNVNGVVCCTANGNCPAGATGIPAGTPIKLNCTNLVGGTVTVGQGAIVGANGGFNISVTNLMPILGGVLNPNLPIPCTVVLPLPINQAVCPTLSTVTGVLTGALSTVQSVVASAVGGLTGIVTVTSFSANATAQA